MKNVICTVLALFTLSLITAVDADAQRKIPTAEQMLSVNGSLGKEFWITVPPNEINPFNVDALEIYVASAFDTEVTVFDASGDRTYKRKVTAGQVRTLSDKRGETNWTWEIREYEQVVRKAIRLTSEQPISVYVLNAKPTTSDGYLAIPTASWGKKYIATTFSDFREFKPWAAGFVIIAKHQGTVVNIQLKGTGKGVAKTSGGKNIGDMWTINMDEGTIYCVIGDGTSRGEFDLSGSTVTSNLPIGFISFHQRTTIPNLLTNGNGRDHLVEMTPPVETWGRKYVSLEYNRNGTNPNAKGDVFKVTAAEDNTKWNLKYYDKTTKQRLGQGGGVLARSGDFSDITNSAGPTILTHGYSVWEADKPIFVTQYSCSASFDGDVVHDPFMINVVPEEQFIPGTIFQTPTDPKFFKHNLNLIVWADTADTGYYNNLRSLKIDGKAVWNHPQSASPTLLFNHMGNNLHWVNLNFGTEAIAHVIEGNGKVKFGGYIYGYGQVDSYGWPAASGFKPTGIVDTLPPVLTFTEECGDYTYEATELRNIPDPPLPEPIDTDQVDQGIADIQFVQEANNYNYQIVLVTEGFPRNPSHKRFSFRLEVIDKSKDAYAEFYVQDWFDNFTYDTVQFFADDIAFNPASLKFGELRLGTKKQMDVTITNNSPGPVTLTESRLETGTYYTIVSGVLPPTVTLAPNEKHTITVEYDGRRDTRDVTKDFDTDTLIVNTECGVFRVGLEGVASVPCIVVENWDAGIRGVNDDVCKPGGLRIQNPGSDTLVITAITGYQSTNFRLSTPFTPALPIKILPKGEVFLKDVCYRRADVGNDSIDVVFSSNADGPFCTSDSVSWWKGGTQAPGPNIIGYDWLRRRVMTLHPARAYVQNTGTSSLTLTGVRFVSTGNQYFPAGATEANYVFKIGQILIDNIPVTNPTLNQGTPQVDVEVFFRPGAVQVYSAMIEPVWAEAGIPGRTAELRGEGIIPTIQTQGASLTCAQTPEEQRVTTNLVITNNGNADLTIFNIGFAPGSDPAWQFAAPPPPPSFVVPYGAGNNSVSIPIEFTRPLGNNNAFNLTVEFEHDAVPGNGNDAIITPIAATERFNVGSCSGPDIVVTNIDFGDNLANCVQPVRTFTITNTGGGNIPLEIRAITPEGPDAANFSVVSILGPGNVTLTTPFSLMPQQSAIVSVRFNPTEPNAAPWAARTYSARFRIMNYAGTANDELVPDTYANMAGIGSVVQMALDLRHNRESEGVINPGDSRAGGADISYTVSIQSQGFGRANLTALNVDVLYSTRNLGGFVNVRPGGALPAGWTVNGPVQTTIDADRSRLSFQLTGPTPIVGNGDLFSFDATLLLGPDFKDDQDLEADLLRPCLIPSTTGTNTQIVNCATTQRVVSIGSVPPALKQIVPNPVVNGRATVQYGVGINAPVTMELINTQGQVVSILVNETLPAGEYELEFETSNLGNGVYFLRMSTVDFTSTQQVVVGK
jgi:hypothetical protein